MDVPIPRQSPPEAHRPVFLSPLLDDFRAVVIKRVTPPSSASPGVADQMALIESSAWAGELVTAGRLRTSLIHRSPGHGRQASESCTAASTGRPAPFQPFRTVNQGQERSFRPAPTRLADRITAGHSAT